MRGVVLGLVVALCGCWDEQVVTELRADGRGTLRLERVYSVEASELAVLSGDDGVQAFVADQLAELPGVSAWTDVAWGVTDAGRVRLAATGWFEDLSAVNRREGEPRLCFDVDEDASGQRVRYGVSFGLGAGEAAFDADAEAWAEERALVLEEVERLLGGYRSRLELRLPGAVVAARGFERGGERVVRLTVTTEMLSRATEAVFEAGEALRSQVETGALSPAEAGAALDARVEELRTLGSVRFVPAATAASGFDAALAEAVVAWEASPLFGRAGEGLAGVFEPEVPEGLESGGPDGFEPNESWEAAAEVALGNYRNLQSSGEDWYRVEVPEGHELVVTIEFDHDVGDLDLGLFLPDGALLDVSAGLGHVEQLSVYSEAGGPLWVRVFHGEGPYHLTLESAPFEPADVYEPNDTPDTAAELEPGEYAELVCGGEDFYAVAVGAGQTLRVTLRFAHEAGDLELALEDPQTGEALALSSGVTDREVAEVQAEGAGWVWVHVYSYGGEVPYSMSVTLE